MTRVEHRSQKDDWGTPQDFYDRLHAEFDFELDAAASLDNAKCLDFYSSGSLQAHWAPDRTFCNPPYGRGITNKWVDKAIEEGKRTLVVMLLPARPSTRWWARAVESCQEVRFVRGRIKFQGATSGAPFPSAVLVWNPWSVPKTVIHSYMDARVK